MTDLATLRGLVPRLSSVPALVYFHENQFAYPVEQAHPRDQVHHQITQIYTALAADRVLFNSDYNRVSFLEGARRLLAKMPDGVPQGWDAQIAERSEILPVPLDAPFFQTPEPSNGPLHLLWNHRWEYDKEPARFFAALALLRAWGVPFCLHVVGQQFRTQPACFAEARETFREQIQTWGYLADRSAYQRLLRRCDLVISTALHEFQGLSVLEACASGCLPLVPDRLAYPQFIPDLWRYPSTPEEPQAEAHALASTLARWSLEREVLRKMPRLDVSGLSWESLASRYRTALEQTTQQA
jgi:glycosyltransferase involved in cell wall biosynthesis